MIKDLEQYLKEVMTMQNKESNMVYVVSLSKSHHNDGKLSYIDIVEKENKYFHPVGDSWPVVPPNYMAFRYDGNVKYIRRVESYVVSQNLHNEIKNLPAVDEKKQYFVYNLGPAISVNLTTTPKMRARRVWVMIDTLFTENNLDDACKITKMRLN